MSATLRRLADNGAVDAVVTMSATADFCERALAPLPSQAGATQQVIADKLGWSRSIVADYAALRKITPDGWNVVAAFQRGALTTRARPGGSSDHAVTIHPLAAPKSLRV